MVKLGQKLTKHDRRICYRRLSDEGLVTPVDIPSSRILKKSTIMGKTTLVHSENLKLVMFPVKLRKANLIDKIKLLPAVGCAMLARVVRFCSKEIDSELERECMREYYSSVVRVLEVKY